MFDYQVPGYVSGTLAVSETTKTIEVLAAGAARRVYVDHVSLGAAGYVYLKRGSTQVTHRFFFPAKGTYPVSQLFEVAASQAFSLVAVLDSTSDGTIVMECSYYTESL